MSKQTKQMSVRYRNLTGNSEGNVKFERSLDFIFLPGCYLVEIEHNGEGLPVNECNDNHYVVGNLVVTESGTVGTRQNDRVIGQFLTYTNRDKRKTVAFIRSYVNGEWGKWTELLVSSFIDEIKTSDDLLALVNKINSDVTTLKGEGKGSVLDTVSSALSKNSINYCADAKLNCYIKELYISGENVAEQGFYIERIIRNANNTCVVAVYSADKSITLYFESLEKIPYGYFKFSSGGYTLEAVINFDKVTERWGDHVCDATTGKLLESSFNIDLSPTIKAIHLHEDGVGEMQNVRNELSSEITKIDAAISSYDVVAIKGKYLTYENGNVSADYADGYYSDFYPVMSGSRVRYSGRASRNAAACAFYDAEKKWISSYPVPRVETGTIDLENVTVEEIPVNARFIRFGSVYRSFSAEILPANLVTLKELDNLATLKELDNLATKDELDKSLENTIRNPLYNKSVDWIGASHMQGIVSGVYTGGFAKIISERNAMTYVNHGIGGTTMSVRADRTNSFVERIETYSKDVDYVIVMGGANDTASVELGALTAGYSAELDKTTFYGACEWMCKYIMENYSDKKYGLIVPFHIASAKLSGEWGDAIVSVCKKWGMPCLDLRCEAGFNLQNVALRKIYGAYVGDVAQYDSTKGYNLDEQVKYEGVLYKADSVIPAPAGDFDASKWTRLQSDGASDYDDWHCNVLGYKKLADVVEAWMRDL